MPKLTQIYRYNFYLDGMIAIRSRFIVQQLAQQGHRPHLQLESFLKHKD
jgi:hypothetical protein